MSDFIAAAAELADDLDVAPGAAPTNGRRNGKTNGTAPTRTSRPDPTHTDTRVKRQRTTLIASLEVETVRRIWERATQRHVTNYQRVSERIADLASQDEMTVDKVLAKALALAAAGHPTPTNDTLLVDLAAAEQREARRGAARHATRLLSDKLSTALGGVVREVDAKVAAALSTEANAILTEARESATALVGITSAEQAIERGLSDAWLVRSTLADRWMSLQRTRLWRLRAVRDGFDHQVSSQPDRLRDGTSKLELAQYVWKSQFDDGHPFSEYDTAEDVLKHYIETWSDGVDIAPIV